MEPADAGRTSKPFNPLLGETYELVHAQKGLRAIVEKVGGGTPPCMRRACLPGVRWPPHCAGVRACSASCQCLAARGRRGILCQLCLGRGKSRPAARMLPCRCQCADFSTCPLCVTPMPAVRVG